MFALLFSFTGLDGIAITISYISTRYILAKSATTKQRKTKKTMSRRGKKGRKKENKKGIQTKLHPFAM